jgi:CTP-dependent riboflavin kinase
MTPAVIELEGVACSGLGEGSGFTALPWAAAQFASKLGFSPHPGTFNLRMQGERWAAARARMATAAGVNIEPPAGFCAARCFAVELPGGRPAAAVVPAVAAYPQDKLELLAAFPVREALDVADGDTVRFTLALT